MEILSKQFLVPAMVVAAVLVQLPIPASGQQSEAEEARMELMVSRALGIRFFSSHPGFPTSLQSKPLFRYDDVPRGYVDGAVWRLGKQGRPLAIITTELHPDYLGGGPRIVYDFLSLSSHPFTAKSEDAAWTPSESAVTMKPLRIADRSTEGLAHSFDRPAQTPSKRLFQMKRIMQRFTANQVVSEESPEEKKLSLRLLPRPIERYRDPENKNSDGAVFLFVAGRMPGVIVFLETDGSKWRYGVGRLSAPSTLVVSIDGAEVWKVPPNFGTWSQPYNASNSSAIIPGYD